MTVAEPAGDPTLLRRIRANRPILDHLAKDALQASDGVTVWSPDGWVMRTHPDVTEALEAAGRPLGLRLLMVFGMATLVGDRDRIVAVGAGTGYVWLPVPDGPGHDRALEAGAHAVAGLRDWVQVDLWRPDLADWLRASTILTEAAPRA